MIYGVSKDIKVIVLSKCDILVKHNVSLLTELKYLGKSFDQAKDVIRLKDLVI